MVGGRTTRCSDARWSCGWSIPSSRTTPGSRRAARGVAPDSGALGPGVRPPARHRTAGRRDVPRARVRAGTGVRERGSRRSGPRRRGETRIAGAPSRPSPSSTTSASSTSRSTPTTSSWARTASLIPTSGSVRRSREQPGAAADFLGAERLAPEQLAGERPDARTDVFAVGVVLFEWLTGERPGGRTSPRDRSVRTSPASSTGRSLERSSPTRPVGTRTRERSRTRSPRSVEAELVDASRAEGRPACSGGSAFRSS